MGLKDRLNSWVEEGLGRANSGANYDEPSTGQIGPASYAELTDPWPRLHRDVDSKRRLLFGVYGDQFLFGPPDTHVLILGSTRQGKTAGLLIPMILAAPGTVVSTSTRKDVLRAAAASRSRKGNVWHLNLDTGESEPGTIPLRYSPITTDYTKANAMAEAMCYAAEVNRDDKGGNSSYFAEQAARLVGPTLLAAGLDNQPIEWVVDIILSQDADRYLEVADILAKNVEAQDVPNAQRELNGILAMAATHGSANDIYATAARAFRVYNRPAIMAMAKDPNFVPQDFVRGHPEAINPGMFTELDRGMSNAPGDDIQSRLPRGYYDSIFITASRRTQDAVAPVIVGLLQALYDTAADIREADDDAGYYRRPPMTWALDEVASMAPWKDFPKVISTAAGDGILIAAVFHDLSQVREKWNDNAPGVLRTNMATTVVFKGINDQQTLKELQESIGYDWVETTSYTTSQERGQSGGFFTGTPSQGSSTSTQTGKQWLPIIDMGTISRGHPTDDNAILALGHYLPYRGTLWAHPAPYYQALPWPEMLVGTALYFHEHVPPDDPRHLLAVPTLDRNGGAALWAQRSPAKAQWVLDTYRWAKARRDGLIAASGQRTDDTED